MLLNFFYNRDFLLLIFFNFRVQVFSLTLDQHNFLLYLVSFNYLLVLLILRNITSFLFVTISHNFQNWVDDCYLENLIWKHVKLLKDHYEDSDFVNWAIVFLLILFKRFVFFDYGLIISKPCEEKVASQIDKCECDMDLQDSSIFDYTVFMKWLGQSTYPHNCNT